MILPTDLKMSSNSVLNPTRQHGIKIIVDHQTMAVNAFGNHLLYLNNQSYPHLYIWIKNRKKDPHYFVNSYGPNSVFSAQINYLICTKESQEVVSKLLSYYQEDASPISKSAQNAANDDHFKSACTRLTKNTHISPINDINIPISCRLFPESLNLNLSRNKRITWSTAKERKRITFSPTEIPGILSKLK